MSTPLSHVSADTTADQKTQDEKDLLQAKQMKRTTATKASATDEPPTAVLMDHMTEPAPDSFLTPAAAVPIVTSGAGDVSVDCEDGGKDTDPVLSPNHKVRFWDAPEVRKDVPAERPQSPTSSSPFQSPKLSPKVSESNMTKAAIMAGLFTQREAEKLPLLRARPNPKLAAMEQRMKFYRALSAADMPFNVTEYPPHVIPPLLGVFDIEDGKRVRKHQSSLATIFCIWNTMLGSTLLAMPWGFATAGPIPAVAMTVTLCLVSFSTCVIVMNRGNAENTMDFSALCLTYVGAPAQRVYQMASVIVFIGAAVAYHNYVTSSLTGLISLAKPVKPWVAAVGSGGLMFLLSIRKDPRFLVRLNSFGVLSVLYTMFFMIYQGSGGDGKKVFSPDNEDLKPVGESDTLRSIAPLAGMLGMSFFIHNAVLPILGNNPNREHHFRDLAIAYLLALVCYLSVGLIPNIFLKGDELRGAQNFLMPFPKDNVLAIIARSGLVAQLTCVYPLILYLIRVEVFGAVLGRKDTYPGLPVLLLFAGALVGLSTVMAIEVPKVGDIMRWVGAVSGLLIIYTLPSLVESRARRHNLNVLLDAIDPNATGPRGYFSAPKLVLLDIVLGLIIVVGLVIFALQFFASS